MRNTFVAACAALLLLCSSASAQVAKTSTDSTKPLHSYFGVWKGNWHVSGLGVIPYNAEVVICIGSKFQSRSGNGDYFGWMNSHSTTFGVKNKDGTAFISELALAPDGTMTFKMVIPAGEETATVRLADNEQLSGMTKFVSLVPTANSLRPAEGTVTLTKIGSLGKNGNCPSSTKWPVS